MMAYLVVEVHHAYKIWCTRGAVKEKPGKKENSYNPFRDGGFRRDKTERSSKKIPRYTWRGLSFLHTSLLVLEVIENAFNLLHSRRVEVPCAEPVPLELA